MPPLTEIRPNLSKRAALTGAGSADVRGKGVRWLVFIHHEDAAQNAPAPLSKDQLCCWETPWYTQSSRLLLLT
jgi:hypothetical protein